MKKNINNLFYKALGFYILLFISNSFSQSQDTAKFIGLGILPGQNFSRANDISPEGLVVVGKSGTSAFLWTEAGGLQELPAYPQSTQCFANGVSYDGTFVVGHALGVPGIGVKPIIWINGIVSGLPSLPSNIEHTVAVKISKSGTKIAGFGYNQQNQYEAAMWNNGAIQNLGYLPGGDASTSTDISPDGSVVVGYDRLYYSPTQPYTVAFRCINGGALQSLGTNGYYASEVWGVSNNGETIVGGLTVVYLISRTAARWTQSGGWESLQGATGNSLAYGVSADGSIIVGFMNGLQSAFIWDSIRGARDLKTVLENEYDLDLTGWTLKAATGIDSSGRNIVGYGMHNGVEEAWWAQLPGFHITEPKENELWIAGEKDTIKWNGGKENQFLQIDYSADSGSTFNIIDIIPNGDTGIYVWDIPQDILSKKCMIRIFDMVDITITDTSEVFKIKPYVLTRDSSGQYEPYRKEEDQWGFWNSPPDIWNPLWYQQFDYQGIDPFTGSQYSQWQGNFVFASSISAEHPDWVSWVNTFGVNECYVSTLLGIYHPAALNKWEAEKSLWNGSCFGIAASNALAFSYKSQFQTKYNNIFPPFANPITVLSNDGVKTVVNELFTHQYGNPSIANDNLSVGKTPNQTLNELKQLLKEDESQPKSLTIYNNGGTGGHTILAYRVRQDPVQKKLYYIDVYDNSNPASNNPITIDTTGNGNNGVWSTPDWAGWGGNGNIYLEITANQYLNGATLPKGHRSVFILSDNVLEISHPTKSSIRIIDNQQNVTGYSGNILYNEIPGSIVRSIKNGSESPPYGYSLPTDDYSVLVDAFTSDTVKTFFFTGNKSFSYKRYDAEQNQTDRFFFDGGFSVANPDQQSKTVSLLNIINETTQEKLFAFSSMELSQNDSVKIENPDSNKIKLVSYGTAKDYDIELNYVKETGIGRFGDFNVQLTVNTSHTVVPDWINLTSTELMVLVDEGNNGTIDDTLFLLNKLTGLGDDQGSLIPTEFRLEQNYPNPFNPTTRIQYAIGSRQFVTLRVYDVLGNKIATLVNEEKSAGTYEVEFNTSSIKHFPSSGIYFYRLQAGSFVETKKMILIR